MTSLNIRENLGSRGVIRPGIVVTLTWLSLLLALSLLALSGCPDGSENGRDINPEEIEVAEDFTLVQTVEGKKAWVLKARSARSLKDEDLITVYEPNLDFYSMEGHVHSTLVSDSGVYFIESSDIKALGSVVVVSADSAVLETDSLKWISKEKIIRTEGSVRVTKGETVITGEGLESDPGLDNIKIERNFRAETIQREPSEGPE